MAPWEQDRSDAQDPSCTERDLSEPLCAPSGLPRSVGDAAGGRESPGPSASLKPTGIPDTIAYLTEEELTLASKDLEDIGYDPQSFMMP
jgi:hypothetical protein